jgi:hypothetical protein
MKINKLLFWLSFSGGLIMIGIGLLLQCLGTSSTQFTYSKFGIGTTTFSGGQSVILGMITLLFSAWNYRNWKTEIKERERRIMEENAPPEKRVKKNRFFRRLQKQNNSNL